MGRVSRVVKAGGLGRSGALEGRRVRWGGGGTAGIGIGIGIGIGLGREPPSRGREV